VRGQRRLATGINSDTLFVTFCAITCVHCGRMQLPWPQDTVFISDYKYSILVLLEAVFKELQQSTCSGKLRC
jgi:uncharacterized Fe-S radical SAM superfamily protein PflX